MNNYSTENEQLNAIRFFFANNGKVIFTAVLLIVLFFVGWRYWQAHRTTTYLATSDRYQQIMQNLRMNKSATVEETTQFIHQNSNIYGALAALNLAKRYLDAAQLEKAVPLLARARVAAADDGLAALAALRLARVKLQLKQTDAALQLLDSIKGESWAAMVASVRGDILLAKGDKAGARAAWDRGIMADPPPALKQIMQIKKDDIN